MTLTPVGSTALWIAAARALESESEHPLFVDPYARDLAGEGGFAFLASVRQAPGGTMTGPDPLLSVRTRFLDDALTAAVEDRRLTQVVIMAAGMDTRAFRLDWPSDTVIFELDRDDVFDYKEPILARLQAVARCDRRVVRVDLAREWVKPLLDAGFDPSRPSAFLIEGLLMYLEPDAAARLFAGLATIAVDGSWLGGDIVNSDMLTSAYTVPTMKRLEQLGCPWRFAPAEPDVFLAANGWHGAVVQPGEPQARFDKWTYPVVPRAIANMPRLFFMSVTRGAPTVEASGPVSIASAQHYTWGEQCDGWHLLSRDSLSVIQERMPPGTSEVRHRHAQATQFFYVLAGELEIEMDGATHRVPAGSGLEVRRGVPHQVFNRAAAAADFLVISQPPSHGDRENVSGP